MSIFHSAFNIFSAFENFDWSEVLNIILTVMCLVFGIRSIKIYEKRKIFSISLEMQTLLLLEMLLLAYHTAHPPFLIYQ